MTWFFRKVGQRFITYCEKLGRSILFLLALILGFPRTKRNSYQFILQIFYIGVMSLLIIIISAAFIGMVIALQGYNTLSKFGSETQLGQLVALSIFRELGPVVSGLLFAGRVGSSLTAEVGLMKMTQQIASLEMMAVNTMRFVLSPRFYAGVLALPLLVIIFDAFSVIGGYFISVSWVGMDSGVYWSSMTSSVSVSRDLLSGIFKAIFFAVMVNWIALYQGFYVEPVAEGMSRASTKTVVYASVMILALDFILTMFTLGVD